MSPLDLGVVESKQLCERTYELVIHAPLVAERARAGQFVILKWDEEGERIPLTIADFDRDRGTVTVVFLVVGRSTREFSMLKRGDVIRDVVGPLGRPTELRSSGKVVCVGGGVGIAAAHPVARAFKEAGATVISIVGARSRNALFWEDKMRLASHDLIVCTDDGSYARKGFVTDALRETIERENVDEVFAVGPTVMMKAVAGVTRPKAIRTIVSLNPIMLDGTGMCGGCRVRVGKEIKFACVDGPDFDAHDVDFDYLMMRQRAYLAEEKIADERCRIHEQHT